MTKLGLYVLLALAASLVASAIASTLGYGLTSIVLGLPALVATGWAAFGHFVTLDDDMPGSWSNPTGEKHLWWRSLLEFAVKAALFVTSIWVVFYWPVRAGA